MVSSSNAYFTVFLSRLGNQPLKGKIIIFAPQRRLLIYVVSAAVAGILTAWFLALPFPRYLLYATAPIEADAVVLFLGGADEAREKQVHELTAQGWAKFVIVPARGEIFEARGSRALVTPQIASALARSIKIEFQQAYVEQTHVEMHQARALMAHIDVQAAIFVSSPYHMRRVKIMADRVFDDDQTAIAFVPTVYDPPHRPWFASGKDVRWVVSEWGKIIWYFIYGRFV